MSSDMQLVLEPSDSAGCLHLSKTILVMHDAERPVTQSNNSEASGGNTCISYDMQTSSDSPTTSWHSTVVSLLVESRAFVSVQLT